MKTKCKEPKAWKFVWKNGKYFSSLKLKTIEAYAEGARQYHGNDCGIILPIYEENHNISEGKA